MFRSSPDKEETYSWLTKYHTLTHNPKFQLQLALKCRSEEKNYLERMHKAQLRNTRPKNNESVLLFTRVAAPTLKYRYRGLAMLWSLVLSKYAKSQQFARLAGKQ